MTPSGDRAVMTRAPESEAAPPRAFEPGPVWMRVLPPLVMLVTALWGITGASYWRDEAATLTAVQRPFGSLVRMLGSVDAVHGVYYLIMWPLVRLAGTSELVTRLPSALAMAAAAAAVAAIGRRLVSPRAGLAAGLVFAILPQISLYAQDARSYAMVAALATTGSYLLVRAIGATGGRAGWLIGYAVSIGAMGLLNAFSMLLLAAHAVTVALAMMRGEGGSPRMSLAFLRSRDGAGGRSLALGWLAASLGAVGLASPVLALGFGQRGTLGWVKAPTARSVAGLQAMIGPSQMLAAACIVVGCGIGASALAGRATLRSRWPRQFSELCLPWLILPPVILVGISFIAPAYTFRYVLYCAPAGALIVGAALAAIGRVAGTAMLAVVALLGLTAQQAERAPDGHGDNIRRADRIIAANSRPGDAVLYVGQDAKYFAAAYPYGLATLDNVAQDRTPAEVGRLVGSELPSAVIRQRLTSISRVWLVSASASHDPNSVILQGLNYLRLHIWHVSRIWLVLYAQRASN